jgi:glycosyltransferase involved in cell wall biosynthesis
MIYSIVIASYNSETTIAQCIESLIRQDFDAPYEIILVDSSNDATPEIVRRVFPQVILIHLDQRAYCTTARNIGIQKARGEIICSLDSDCIARPDWLSRIASAHKEYPDYAAIGGCVANANPENLLGWTAYLAEFREFFPFHPKQFMPNIPTCNISYKRRVFEKYGEYQDLYPDCIKVKHPQQLDLIFHLKLVMHHEKILFDPEIQVAHINITGIKRFILHQYRLGRITSLLLRHFSSLNGAFIARSRILAVLAAPLLPMIKFMNTFRVARLSREYVRHFYIVAPLLFIGLMLFWATGFVRGAFLPLKKE